MTAVGGAFTWAVPQLKVLHSLSSRDPAPPVGEEPQRGLGVREVGAVAAERLSGGPDAIRRALRD